MCTAGKGFFKVILLGYCDEHIKMIGKSKIVQYDLEFFKKSFSNLNIVSLCVYDV